MRGFCLAQLNVDIGRILVGAVALVVFLVTLPEDLEASLELVFLLQQTVILVGQVLRLSLHRFNILQGFGKV